MPVENDAIFYLVREGDQWLALTSYDLQAGISGYGDTPSQALRMLADRLDEKEWRP